MGTAILVSLIVDVAVASTVPVVEPDLIDIDTISFPSVFISAVGVIANEPANSLKSSGLESTLQ